MGADVLQPTIMSSVHHYLGEIGADLFERLFLGESRLKTVCAPPAPSAAMFFS
jgi:hypothetical protein